MKTKQATEKDFTELRRSAEDRVKKRTARSSEKPSALPADHKTLLHELQIHQVELEMQNEELKRSRLEVEKGLARYTALYEFAPVGYFTLERRSGAIRQVNLTGARLLSVERSLLVNMRFESFVAPSDRSRFDAFLRKIFESRLRETCEVMLRAAKGRPSHVQIEAVVFDEESPECLATVLDISERIEQAGEIAHLASFPTLDPDPIVEIDLAGGTRFANPAARELFPDLPEQGTAHPWLRGLETMLPGLMADQRKKTGREIRIGERWYAQGIFFVEETQRIRVYGRNITARKLAEERLQESERLYRTIGESIDYGVWVSESDGRNIYASESLLRMAGLTQEQIADFGWMDLVHPDDAAGLRAAWKECVRMKGPWDAVYRFRGCDGQWHPILARGLPVYNEQNEIQYWAGINLDIGRQMEIEEHLREKNLQLEAANREMESFSYSVSHDLHAPLRAIDGFARMLRKQMDTKLDDEEKRKFEVIRENARKMSQLIDDLLTFSRLGRQMMSRTELGMEEIAGQIRDELLAINPGREISLTIGQMPKSFGDRTLIRQVYSNLLGNAVKFTRGRNPARIEAGCLSGDGDPVYFVKDNGIGFDMKFHDKIFGVFQRLHTEDEYEGTGIGLALVQRFINRHGGRLWAESKPNEGAAFYFTLPVQH
jgi:PAS domain S-box-containing protein